MAAFTPDGTYRRVERCHLPRSGRTFPLENYGRAFSDYCYPSGTIILAQLGVLGAVDAAVARMPNRGPAPQPSAVTCVRRVRHRWSVTDAGRSGLGDR
jgi:hypothetical protein